MEAFDGFSRGLAARVHSGHAAVECGLVCRILRTIEVGNPRGHFEPVFGAQFSDLVSVLCRVHGGRLNKMLSEPRIETSRPPLFFGEGRARANGRFSFVSSARHPTGWRADILFSSAPDVLQAFADKNVRVPRNGRRTVQPCQPDLPCRRRLAMV